MGGLGCLGRIVCRHGPFPPLQRKCTPCPGQLPASAWCISRSGAWALMAIRWQRRDGVIRLTARSLEAFSDRVKKLARHWGEDPWFRGQEDARKDDVMPNIYRAQRDDETEDELRWEFQRRFRQFPFPAYALRACSRAWSCSTCLSFSNPYLRRSSGMTAVSPSATTASTRRRYSSYRRSCDRSVFLTSPRVTGRSLISVPTWVWVSVSA